ncbi:MAG TPA: AAA family ATPase [Gemmatales bacterium]|nr:AAA family ATPase [Gemmatales bacterium]
MPEPISLAPTTPIQKQRWLFPNLIPRGELVLLDGNSGVGKSLMTATLATCFGVLRSDDDERLILVLTSPQQRSLVAEFLANQEPDYDYIRGIEYQPASDEPEPLASFAPHLLLSIENILKEHRPMALLIDSLEEILQFGGETDTKQLIELWTGLRTLAHTHDCTLIIPRRNGLHENRQYGPFTRIGSDTAHFGLTMHWHPTDPSTRVVTVAKNLRGPTGGQTHVNISPNGIVSFNTTDPHEHVRPSRSTATWVPEPQHIMDEDKRIISFAEKLLDGRPMPKIELENHITRAGITKPAFQRAMSKAKLRNLDINGEPHFGPTQNMLMRHLIRKADRQKAQENQARTRGSEGVQEQGNTTTPIRPAPALNVRQAG